MKPNLDNPLCPKCNERMQRLGYIGTLQGRKRRYRCNHCGFTMTGEKIEQ